MLASFVVALPGTLAADDPPDSQHPARRQFSFPWPDIMDATLLDREHLTGSWGGLRDTLRGLGITPTLTFVTDVLGNPVGGVRHGLRETDNLGVDVTFDLDRLVGWTGGRFHVSASLRSGTNLSGDDVGNVFNVAQVCCAHTYRLVDVALEQSLWGDAINLWAGRIATGDDFLTSPLYANFIQSGVNGNPAGILLNLPVAAYSAPS